MNLEQRIEELERETRRLKLVGGGLLIGLAAVLLLGGASLLDLAYGAGYGAGASVLMILTAGMLPVIWMGPVGPTLAMTGGQRTLMWTTLACGALAISSAIAVVEIWGAEGVALAFATARIVRAMILLMLVRARLGIWTFAKISWLLAHRH